MIHNIHILTQADSSDQALRARAMREEMLIEQHRRGEHTYGSMHRDCPLCQMGK